jgi:hypothetical protein
MFQSLRTNELFDDYVVFDIETSGLNPHKDKIIEIGAIKYINNEKVEEFSYLIDPEIKLEPIITRVTGLTDEDLKGKKKIEEVLPMFLNFIKDIGRPTKDPTNIDKIDACHPKTNPNTNINLISPPPIDSFLNIKSPSNFIKNIIPNAIIPSSIDHKAPGIPFCKNITIIKQMLLDIKT